MNEGERRLTADELAYHLQEHFDALEASLEHDREFQLGATWGIVRGANMLGAMFGAGWATDKLGLTGWLGGIVWFFLFAGVLVALSIYTERGFEGDKGKLSRLPKWADRNVHWWW